MSQAQQEAQMALKIVSARITPPAGFGDMAKVFVTLENGEELKAFDYFDDELSFSTQEFVGKTLAQACDLRHQKDVAYLRS